MAESSPVAPSPPALASHWDHVYATTAPDRWSWHESAPLRSLEAIVDAAEWVDAAIVDVGGGNARLVDLLIDRGYRNLSVVDITATPLLLARTRLGEAEQLVDWITDDVGAPFGAGEAIPWRRAPYVVWHDRAVFHFLLDPAQQEAYINRIRASVAHGGHVMLSVFDTGGPERCSGLPVVRRSLEELTHVLPAEFDLCSAERFTHLTPSGEAQAFVRCAWQRVG